jgi:hypothetical protein
MCINVISLHGYTQYSLPFWETICVDEPDIKAAASLVVSTTIWKSLLFFVERIFFPPFTSNKTFDVPQLSKKNSFLLDLIEE